MTHHHPDLSRDPNQNTLPVEVPEQTHTPEEVQQLVAVSELQTNTGGLDYLEQRPESKLSKEAKDLLVALRGDRDLPEERDVPVPAESKPVESTPQLKPSPVLHAKLPPKKAHMSYYFDGAKLTDKQQECAELRWEYGLSVPEISRRLGKSRRTIDGHLEAATEKMRQAMEKERGARNRAKHDVL